MMIFPTWKSGRPFASTEPLDRCTRDCLCGTLEPESAKFTGQMDPLSSTHFRTWGELHHTAKDVSISQWFRLGVDGQGRRETHLDPTLSTCKTSTSRPSMLYMLSRGWASPNPRIRILGGIHGTRCIWILADIRLLHMRVGIGGERTWHSVVHWTLGYGMRERAIGSDQVGEVLEIGIDTVVLGRREVLVVGIVSRHGVSDAETGQAAEGGRW
jgi:hypothetical protein